MINCDFSHHAVSISHRIIGNPLISFFAFDAVMVTGEVRCAFMPTGAGLPALINRAS